MHFDMKRSKSIGEHRPVRVVDLFCGIGGMTRGFIQAGFKVEAGIDIDTKCKYGFERSNKSRFVAKDIEELSAKELKREFGKGRPVRVLIGCAPCQPFSALNSDRESIRTSKRKRKWASLNKFMSLIEEVKPEIVSMENVRELAKKEKYPIFTKFLRTLRENEYSFHYEIVDASLYGVPQKRKRLVLLASRLGPIRLVPETHDADALVTVKEAIGHLPALAAGGIDDIDPLHRARNLSKLNLKRIESTPHDGGGAKDWADELVLKCHRKDTGTTYKSTVYGRMRWDHPSPTITTECMNLGSGRFGHPTQHRAISLREAAILQSFPKTYVFARKREFSTQTVARHIGNAVPVRLGKVIAMSIKRHLKAHQATPKSTRAKNRK